MIGVWFSRRTELPPMEQIEIIVHDPLRLHKKGCAPRIVICLFRRHHHKCLEMFVQHFKKYLKLAVIFGCVVGVCSFENPV